jgi:subtilisin family serine protease
VSKGKDLRIMASASLFSWDQLQPATSNRSKDEALELINKSSESSTTSNDPSSERSSTQEPSTQAASSAPVASATTSPTNLASGAGPLQHANHGSGAPELVRQFIVFLDEAPGREGVSQRAQALMRSLGVDSQPSLVFDQLNGFALNLTDQQAQRLRALGGVRSVEADAAVFLDPPILNANPTATLLRPQAAGTTSLTSYGNSTAGSGETLPWGVRAVWQGDDISARGNFASDTFAFVIDSGVLSTTGDLNLASTSSWHRSWISGESAFTDGNGHGSHVAGTIAALANGQGVVGVAPGANVVSLKVFDSSGGGASYSSIIDAINHAVAVINNNGLDKSKVVINMSLGGGFSSSLDTAVKNAANQNIRFAVAAGNDGKDADNYSPAAAGDHPNVFTISAVDSAYRMPSWSNWDRITSTDKVDDVDFAAPGVSVLSYYRNGQLAYLSGTSMAAPHVAGLLMAGGVQASALVTPYYTGTADPFALGVPSTSGPTDPEPVPEPDPEPNTDLILWGTTGNDVITGGSGNDRLSGVLATGTTAAAMGAGQIDSLTGGAGADIFVLGDSRGVFYDDRQNNNLGTEDYALIKDFRSGEDKLQLRESSYLFTVSSNNLSLYWDRNGNGKLDTGGRNRDELIAVLEGVSGLSSGDILWV